MANASTDAADVGENGTNEGDTQEDASPVNANGKRAPRFIQDKGKKPKTGTALMNFGLRSRSLYTRNRRL